MSESSKDRFDTLTDQELADHVASGHVEPKAGQAELDRRAREAAKASDPAPKPASPADTGK